MDERVGRFVRALLVLESEIDWERLGSFYCWEGGESFFPPAQRDAIRDAGLALAADLGEALPPRRPGSTGASVYVGAATAELAPLLFEHLLLGRQVRALNLACEERDHLNRALVATEGRTELALPRIEDTPLADLPRAAFDHAWLVSVLTDPEVFPALHDRLYERRAGRDDLATGTGDLEAELVSARALIAELLDRLTPPALLTTTDEELPLVAEAVRARGWRLRVAERARLSAIVGDPVRISRVEPL